MRTLVIHNPRSGFGSDAIYQFERALLREGDECVVRLLPPQIDARSACAGAESFDVVVVSGGDGTVAALLYELAVLKVYAEPLLFGIPRESPEYDEAKRILKFLDYFLPIDSEMIPKNSIVREFIGGSCLKV